MKVQNVALILMLLIFGISLYGVVFPPTDDYSIIINGNRRDVRQSPHWDLIQLAWQNDNHELMLKMNNNPDRKGYYNWMEDKFITGD
jgi:hypothetical protein